MGLVGLDQDDLWRREGVRRFCVFRPWRVADSGQIETIEAAVLHRRDRSDTVRPVRESNCAPGIKRLAICCAQLLWSRKMSRSTLSKRARKFTDARALQGKSAREGIELSARMRTYLGDYMTSYDRTTQLVAGCVEMMG